MSNRIKYLDVAKFIGIFCIFLEHFGESAGNAYTFVFRFHVALFFFLSGCTESMSIDVPWYQYLCKNIKGILIPCYLFAIISIVVQSIYTNTHAEILPNLIQVLKGCVRNHFFVYSLWFLTCLFVVKITFYILRKVLKYRLVVFLACVALYCIAQFVITPKPTIEPRMPYNIDSACHYIMYYALGYCCFGMIRRLLDLDSTVKKIIYIGVGMVSFAFTAALFFGKNLLDFSHNSTVIDSINSVLSTVIVILCVLFISKLIENVNLFIEIGKSTLFLCGSEYVVKLLVRVCFQTIGLEILLANPIAVYIYTFALLILCYKVFVPIEKAVFMKLRFLKRTNCLTASND